MPSDDKKLQEAWDAVDEIIEYITGENMDWFAKEIAPKGFVTVMEHAGCKASLMRAPRLKSKDDRVFDLPQGSPIPVFPIASLPGSPDDWVREAGTYVVPVDEDWGLWFDFTMNDKMNTAVIPSVKGMNPITGLKLEGFGMEQYADRCPKHDEPFAHGRLCEKCGYEWPSQNYMTYDGGQIWWDGFRQPDGSVRQFFFSADEERDVASHVIGKKNTVPAFGFAFYKTKVSRENPRSMFRSFRPVWIVNNNDVVYGASADGSFGVSGSMVEDDSLDMCDGDVNQSFMSQTVTPDMESEVKTSGLTLGFEPAMGRGIKTNGGSYTKSKSRSSRSPFRGDRKIGSKSSMGNKKSTVPGPQEQRKMAQATKSVSVGAGAKINQSLEQDSLGLDGWQDKPSGVIRLYFCFKEKFQQIVKQGGVKDLTEVSNDEGYLKNIPVG